MIFRWMQETPYVFQCEFVVSKCHACGDCADWRATNWQRLHYDIVKWICNFHKERIGLLNLEPDQCHADPCIGEVDNSGALYPVCYMSLIKDKVCPTCKEPLSQTLDAYHHDHGWVVAGFNHKLWLSVHCRRCNYDWSLTKLGVPVQ